MTHRILYGLKRDELIKEATYTSEKSARAAFYALEFDRWCVLMRGNEVLMSNLDCGPIVEPRDEENKQ